MEDVGLGLEQGGLGLEQVDAFEVEWINKSMFKRLDYIFYLRLGFDGLKAKIDGVDSIEYDTELYDRYFLSN